MRQNRKTDIMLIVNVAKEHPIILLSAIIAD